MSNIILQMLMTLIFGVFLGGLLFYMGIKGRKFKKERELHGDYQELPGPFEGALEKGWFMFVFFGLIWILYTIIYVFKEVFL